jgi:6-phosphogluconolactonase
LNDEFSGGANPAFVVVDGTGKYVLVSNYYGGKVGALPVQEDGRLGEATAFVHRAGSSVNKVRQEGPHPHSVYVSPDNRFVIACDLGLDKILVYRFDATKGTLTPNDPPYASVNPGAGPRHLAFSPNGKFAFVVNELQSSISAFSYDAQRGVLYPLQTISTLPSDFKGENTGAEIEVSPSGKFLYASNRGDDSIAVFAIDATRGALTPIEHVSTQGKTPRNFAIDLTGAYMFVGNQDSDNIVVFHIDSKSGQLKPTGQVLKVVSPTCITFLPLQ